jgi:hypothetical protein
MTTEHRKLIIELAAIATAATWLLGTTRGIREVPVLIGFLALGAVSWALLATITANPHLATCVAAWAVTLGGWVAWARHARDPWAWTLTAELLIPAAILTTVTLITAHQQQKTPVAEAPKPDKVAWWAELFTRTGFDGVTATSDRRISGNRVVTLSLPSSGRVTLDSLQAAARNIAVALKAKPASVTFEEGDHAGQVIMHIDERNAIAETTIYRPSGTARTVNEPLVVGTRPDSKPSALTVRGTGGMLITGVNGSGKTTFLNVLIARLVECTDVVVCVIDLKGGRLAAPWIRPWVEGRCPRPAVDWVATTRAEAWEMMQAMDDVITDRAASLAGGSKITPSRELPQFVVICDEMADVTGAVAKADQGGISPYDTADLGAKVTRKGRSEAQCWVWATQRGTVDFTGSTAIKSQCKVRVSLSTASQADARAVTDSAAVARLLVSARQPGCAVIEAPDQRDAVLTKIFRLDADDDATLLDQIAEEAGRTRPMPDPRALAAMGDRYAGRWRRSELYQSMLADFHDRTGQAPLPAAPPVPPARPSAAAVAQVDVNQEAAELLQSAGLGGAKPDPEGRMWSLLAGKPVMGLTVLEIGWTLDREGLGVHRSTIYRWLGKAEKDGKVRRASGDGDTARWVLI